MTINDTDNFPCKTQYANELKNQRKILGSEAKLEPALTKKCLQYLFSVAYYFPSCPDETENILSQIEAYFQNLRIGAIFAYNDDSPKLIIGKFKMIKNTSIVVMCEREGRMCEREGFKPWSIFKIIFDNNYFIHANLGSYFEIDCANEKFSDL